MSKGHNSGEKTKETPHGETKKQGEVKPNEASQPNASKSTQSKGHTPMPGGCFSWECKSQATQFNFCSQHFEHFKFGLIKKTGEPVPDYEKKMKHFQAHKARKDSKKVA